MSLKLWYENETDLDRILNQLREAENIEEIEFSTLDSGLAFSTGEQRNENICEIIKMILRKPNLTKITYGMEIDGDFNGMEINGEFPQVVYQWALTTKSLEVRNLEGCTLCLFMFSFQ